MKTKAILNFIEASLQMVEMSFEDSSWRADLPSGPGWYFIETNTPPDVFIKVGNPKGIRHYNIPEKVNASRYLKRFGACILPVGNSFYFIYSGEAKNLKARAREHVSGHSKTGCLALENYPLLYQYEWRFHFTPCDFDENPNDSKLLRIFGEQIWRSKYGWPILCGK